MNKLKADAKTAWKEELREESQPLEAARTADEWILPRVVRDRDGNTTMNWIMWAGLQDVDVEEGALESKGAAKDLGVEVSGFLWPYMTVVKDLRDSEVDAASTVSAIATESTVEKAQLGQLVDTHFPQRREETWLADRFGAEPRFVVTSAVDEFESLEGNARVFTMRDGSNVVAGMAVVVPRSDSRQRPWSASQDRLASKGRSPCCIPSCSSRPWTRASSISSWRASSWHCGTRAPSTLSTTFLLTAGTTSRLSWACSDTT